MKRKLIRLRKSMFPKNFQEKYAYLGSVPYEQKKEDSIFKAMQPLIIFMDYKAKPWWCPRWVLRLLHLWGNDNSVVRVRNWKLHNLHRKLTKGIFLTDWKTKWYSYDLRISVRGDQQIYNLACMIEYTFYKKGYKQELIYLIKKVEPTFDADYITTKDLEGKLEELGSAK